MPTGFSDQFESYLPPSAETTKSGMLSGLVVLDANVLLSAYRFAPKARGELLSILERLQDRLWLPHQVALEFHKNRYEVIFGYAAAYKSILDALSAHQEEYEPELDEKIRNLANRAALVDTERDHLLGLMRSSLGAVRQAVESLRDRHGLSKSLADDPILAWFQRIFDDRVGQPFSAEDEAKAREEADRRIREKVPPGYRDSNKLRPHGDYFLWLQTLRETARRRTEVLVFITDDVKEDWYLRVSGQTIAARPELVDEALSESGARLVMMQTKSFLRHAKEYLNAEVSPETIQQAGQLPNSEVDPQRREVLFVNLKDTENFLHGVRQNRDRLREQEKNLFSALKAEWDGQRHSTQNATLNKEMLKLAASIDEITAERKRLEDAEQALVADLHMNRQRYEMLRHEEDSVQASE